MTPRRPKAITFDFFNTLAYHRDGGGRGMRLVEYLRGEGLSPSDWRHEILYEIFDVPYEGDALERPLAAPAASSNAAGRYGALLVRRAFERLEIEASERELARYVAPVWRILGPAAFGVFEDAPAALRELRAEGYALAVISNWPRGLRYFCDELGLSSYFDLILASGEIGAAKPQPEIFAAAAARLRVAPREILHVGDSPIDDLAGATGAGFGGLLVARAGAGVPPAELSAGHALAGLDMLPRWLRQQFP